MTGDGYCYVWNETQAQRGANEIGSVLFLFLKENLHPGVKHVVITSDSTVSQNRNYLVACCLLLAVQTLPEIVTIEQKFSEIGHTHMEGRGRGKGEGEGRERGERRKGGLPPASRGDHRPCL